MGKERTSQGFYRIEVARSFSFISFRIRRCYYFRILTCSRNSLAISTFLLFVASSIVVALAADLMQVTDGAGSVGGMTAEGAISENM